MDLVQLVKSYAQHPNHAVPIKFDAGITLVSIPLTIALK